MTTSTLQRPPSLAHTLQLLTKKQVVAHYNAITMAWLDKALLHRRENGLDQCVIRLGKRVCLDQHRFEAWLEGFREVRIVDELDRRTAQRQDELLLPSVH